MWGVITLCSLLLKIFEIFHNQKLKTNTKFFFKSCKGTLGQLSDFTDGKTGHRHIKLLVHDDAYPCQSFHTNRINKIDLCKIQNDSVDVIPWGHKSLQFFRKCALDDHWRKFYFIILFFRLCSIFSIYFCILCQKLSHTRFL